MTGRTLRLAVVAAAFVLVAAVLWSYGPIAQDPSYHRFADRRTFLGIPNFLDVVSNLPIGVVVIAGLVALRRASPGAFRETRERWPWRVAFLALVLTAPGSAWYHLDPTNATLTWDRLPLAVLFASVLAALLAERVHVTFATRALPVFVVAAVVSVAWWHVGESRGTGDLRPYAIVQYAPLAAIPLLFALFPAPYTRGRDFAWAALWYLAAKMCEALDGQIYAVGGVVGGHTLKHVASAVGAWQLVVHVRRRATLRREGVA